MSEIRAGIWGVQKGSDTSGHYGHEGRQGQQGGSVGGTTLRAISQHVWDRAGKRARFKLIRTAVGHLRKNPVLPESKKAKWHLPMVFEGKVAGILVGDDARAITVLGPKMKPYPDSELVRFS